jgi:glutamate-1-semialdehyde 2,1-aminomutase
MLGGGLPAAAYGGRADLMAEIAPDGPVYQAGTLSGNPLAMAAGLATLERLGKRGTYPTLTALTETLTDGLAALASEAGVELTTAAVGGMFGFFFHPGPVVSFEDAKKSNAARFRAFFHAMLEGGVYLAPSAYEAGFVSLAHRARELDKTLEAARRAFRKAARA